MLGWLAVAGLAGLAISAHVRAVSAQAQRAAAIRAHLESERGRTIIAAVSNVATTFPVWGGGSQR